MFVRGGVLLTCLFSLLWAAPMSVDSLKGRVQGAITATIGNRVDRLTLAVRPLPSSPRWPDETADIKITIPERPFGLIVVPVEWTVEGRRFQIPVQVQVSAYDDVLISHRNVDRLSLITDKDVVLVNRDVSSFLAAGKELIHAPAELNGKRTRVFVKKGELLSKDMLEINPDIIKGQSVTLYVAEGAIEVCMPVIAQQDGHIGDSIRVKGNKTDMKATIESETRVRAER